MHWLHVVFGECTQNLKALPGISTSFDPNENKMYLYYIEYVFYATVDMTTETMPQDTAGLLCLTFSLCAALVFPDCSLWAAGCGYVFVCR